MSSRKARRQKPARYLEPSEVAEARGAANAVVWRAWPWLSWCLPVALYLIVAGSGAGGWEMLFLFLFSPVVLPVMALLNLLPRMVLRRAAGFTSSTTGMSVSLIVHWWGLTLAALVFRGAGDSGDIDSVLGEMFSGMDKQLEQTLFGIAGALVVASYIALLVFMSIALSDGVDRKRDAARAVDSQGQAPSAPVRLDPLGTRASIVVNSAALLMPVLIVAGIAGGIGLVGVKEDRILAEQEQLWSGVQEQLSPIRAAIADEPWNVGRSGEFPYRGTYRVEAGWWIDSEDSVEEMTEHARAVIEEAGWSLQPVEVRPQDEEFDGVVPGSRVEFEATDSEGSVIGLRVESRPFVDPEFVNPEAEYTEGVPFSSDEVAERTYLELTLSTREHSKPADLHIFWHDRRTQEEIDTNLDRRNEALYGPARQYAADEWPSLAHTSSTLFS